VLQDDSVREAVVDTIVDALPVTVAGRQDVEDAITAIATPASAAGFLSLIVFAWAATGMMTALRRGLERAMCVTQSRPLARGKLVDFALIVGAAALVLVNVAITLVGTLLQTTSGRVREALDFGMRAVRTCGYGDVRALDPRRAAAVSLRTCGSTTASRERSSRRSRSS
jgi:uncharacterized BrkB/YihY/UPF0761 family membrane protein